MANDTANPGDPARSIALLWGLHEPGRRGPKPKLSAEAVVDAAIALADREGLAAVSMRRVAESLGLSPMALYTYAPSKGELVDLMLDRIWRDAILPPQPLAGWREKLEFIARQQWEIGQRHPWVLVATHRPALGPNFVAHLEAAFSAVDGLGLDELEMEMTVRLVTDYARGAVRSALEGREVEQRTGVTDAEWMAVAEPALQQVLDPEAFPVLIRVGAACNAGQDLLFDRDRGFEFGLQRVLDGVEAFIAVRRLAKSPAA
ncbi:MAG: TetR/AcrR family transcriptional regulator [Phenylobacterium sp.]